MPKVAQHTPMDRECRHPPGRRPTSFSPGRRSHRLQQQVVQHGGCRSVRPGHSPAAQATCCMLNPCITCRGAIACKHTVQGQHITGAAPATCAPSSQKATGVWAMMRDSPASSSVQLVTHLINRGVPAGGRALWVYKSSRRRSQSAYTAAKTSLARPSCLSRDAHLWSWANQVLMAQSSPVSPSARL